MTYLEDLKNIQRNIIINTCNKIGGKDCYLKRDDSCSVTELQNKILDEEERLLNGRGLQIELKDNNLDLEINMNYICKDTIKKRKSLYGNNFKEISQMQSEYLGIKVTEKDVAMNLAILKKVRIDFIKSKLQEFRNNPRFNDYDIQIQIKDLNSGLEDSQKDFHNYLFIALNYNEYEKL